MKQVIIFASIVLLGAACGSKKKYAELLDKYNKLDNELGKTRLELAACLDERKKASGEVEYLRSVNYKLLNNIGDLSTLSKKEAENLERSLETLRERDLQIKTLRDALSKKDSVLLALVTSVKGALGDLNDEDIQVNVDKGVVFISISDRFLFKSGSYELNQRAKEVLGKVAKIANARPELELMVEGHTDNVPFRRGLLLDNWDLSVKRATEIVRVLQLDHGINPERITAAGRGEYVPVASNESPEGRAANRRTRILLLPKIDQFYNMIEEGMKALK
ncbi:MAG: flagellar motor protein MotB [Thermaurantimonas sp.]